MNRQQQPKPHAPVKLSETEICNECGCSVKFGSGNYVNRIPDCNSEEERIENGKPYPKGEYVCANCETKN